jgi:hypothetical protein
MLNSASAAAFISGHSGGAARRELPGAAARKEKNGLHRAPLLKSPLARRRRETGGKPSVGRGRGGRAGSRDAVAVAAVAAATAAAKALEVGAFSGLPTPLPAPPSPGGEQGRGAAARAQRRGRGRRADVRHALFLSYAYWGGQGCERPRARDLGVHRGFRARPMWRGGSQGAGSPVPRLTGWLGPYCCPTQSRLVPRVLLESRHRLGPRSLPLLSPFPARAAIPLSPVWSWDAALCPHPSGSCWPLPKIPGAAWGMRSGEAPLI